MTFNFLTRQYHNVQNKKYKYVRTSKSNNQVNNSNNKSLSSKSIKIILSTFNTGANYKTSKYYQYIFYNILTKIFYFEEN